MEHIIDIQDVHKFYQMGDGVLEVLKGVSLLVDQGEYLAILGPSGSGKSTLMNIIGCMDVFQQGQYTLAGNAIHTMNDAKLTRVRNQLIGFIFQRYHLLPKYNVVQNVMMPLLIRGMSRREAQSLAVEKLALLEMDKRLFHKPSELSGGQQQRVAIARALVGNPKLLLADEPTGALDSQTGRDVLKLFAQLNDMGHTIVMITHDLSVAEHARRVVKIIDGELFEQEQAQLPVAAPPLRQPAVRGPAA